MASSKHRSSDSVSPENPITKFAAQLIRRKARELVARSGFSPSDRDDIEQELRLILLRRLDKFDPSVAHYNAFVTTVIERYSATILEHRCAESRFHRRYGGSLNQLVDDGDGNKIEMGAKLPEDQQCMRTMRDPRGTAARRSPADPRAKPSAKPRLVLSTMQTASTDEFRAKLRQGDHLFLVADEVHRMGSTENRKLFSLASGPRLGLSATPRRAGDPEGTQAILEYFQGIVPPPFTLKDAIPSALTPYFYYVHTIRLTPDEQSKWEEISKRLSRFLAQASKPGSPDASLSARIQQSPPVPRCPPSACLAG